MEVKKIWVIYHVLKLREKKNQFRVANNRDKEPTFLFIFCEELFVAPWAVSLDLKFSIFDCKMRLSPTFAPWVVGRIVFSNPSELLYFSLAYMNMCSCSLVAIYFSILYHSLSIDFETSIHCLFSPSSSNFILDL